MLKADRAFLYTSTGTPVGNAHVTHTDMMQGKASICSVILEELGAMEGDAQMVRDIFRRRTLDPALRFTDEKTVHATPMSLMDFPHYAIDQHTNTYIVLLLHAKRKKKEPASSATPFGATLQKLFKKGTGRNARRGDTFDATRWTNAIFEAQAEIYKHMVSPAPCPAKATATMAFSIPTGNLAGRLPTKRFEVGKIRITVDPNNLQRLVATRIVGRDNKVAIPTVTKREGDDAQRAAKKLLMQAEGIALVGRALVPEHTHAYARLASDATWHFKKKGETVFTPWETARHVTQPVHQTPTVTAIQAVVASVSSSKTVMRRAITLLNSWSVKTRMPKISRSGGSSEEKVIEEDADTFLLLDALATQFPDGLWPSTESRFVFQSRSVLVKQRIKEGLQGVLRAQTPALVVAAAVALPALRVEGGLTENQTAVHERIKASIEADAFIQMVYLYMRMGSGKTYVTASLMAVLWRHHPELGGIGAVWTAPKHAVVSVAAELHRRLRRPDGSSAVRIATPVTQTKRDNDRALAAEGLTTTLVREGSAWQPEAGVVTVLHHDDLLRLQKMGLLFDSSNYVMVVDEAHKCMNNTGRTDCARDLAANSRFCFLLSGTPITKNEQQLCGWLRACVPFHIEPTNQWTAVNSMYKQIVDTGIHLMRTRRDVPIPASAVDDYWPYVPKKWGGQLVHCTLEHMMHAFKLCRKIADKRMVKCALRYVSPPCDASIDLNAELIQQIRTVTGGEGGALQERIDEMATLLQQPVAQRPDTWEDEWETLLMDICTHYPEPFGDTLLRRRRHRVLLVADTSQHAEALRAQLAQKASSYLRHGMTATELRIQVGPGDFQESTVSSTSPHIAIVTKKQCEGWNGTLFTVLMKGVYFGNQADRSQMDGRVDRLGAVTKVRWILTYTAGLQERFLRYQERAGSLEDAIREAHASMIHPDE
jgi:hypothetical protein